MRSASICFCLCLLAALSSDLAHSQTTEESSSVNSQNPSPRSGESRSLQDIPTGQCRFQRGRQGKWVQDMEYAAKAQYNRPLKHYSGNANNLFLKKKRNGEYPDLEYRPATTYRWEDEVCPVTLLTLETMCETMRAMELRRIFILGDSLSLQLAQSFFMWLSEKGEWPTPRKTLEPNFSHILECPNIDYNFKLQFVRNDEILENDQPVSVDNEQSNCHTYCYPWTKEYLEDRHRTLLIANVGAHLHDYDLFQGAVDRFLQQLVDFQRPYDIVLWRTLVPGHWDCAVPNRKPFPNYQAYLNESRIPEDDAYSWDRFQTYNQYAMKQIQLNHERPGPRTEVVDVFPMTILRQDGHCSDEFRPPAFTDKDCLHYDLPGPTDWWSHMIMSHLLDILDLLKEKAQQAN